MGARFPLAAPWDPPAPLARLRFGAPTRSGGAVRTGSEAGGRREHQNATSCLLHRSRLAGEGRCGVRGGKGPGEFPRPLPPRDPVPSLDPSWHKLPGNHPEVSLMAQNPPAAPQAPPPHVQLIQMATGYWVSRLLYVAAKLELADRIAGSPKSAAELAGETGTQAPALHRLMRTLASLGVLTETDGQRFALTPVGEALRKGAYGSAHATVLTLAGPTFYRAWDEVLYSFQTGKTSFEKTFGMPAFDYLAKHPEEGSLFIETMVGFHGDEPPAVAAAYDFSGFRMVVDVGGATGNMLAAVLSRHPSPRGVLFDLPHVRS